jgi:hypothetical protein
VTGRGPALEIVCVDCGGRAHLISYAPEDGAWEPGDVVTYRCAECLDRWDLVLEADDLAD